MKDVLITGACMICVICIVFSSIGSSNDCGNAKVVRGVEQIDVNQDSIDEAYYHAKADSMIKAIRNKKHEQQY